MAMFTHLTQPNDLSSYTLRGVTDFSNLAQINNLESGYPFLVVVSIPDFLRDLKSVNDGYKLLIDDYVHILEYEFRGIDGLDNITTDTSEFTNGISSINVITKVTQQGGSEFTMRFFEKAGSVITRTHELYLRGIKDPRSQAKRYCGLLDPQEDGSKKVSYSAGFEHEVFTLLYFVTDNTITKIEKAYLIVGAQPNTAETNIYNQEKGDIGFKELSVSFNGFPITNNEIDRKAQSILNWMNNPKNKTTSHLTVDSAEYKYQAVDNVPETK